MLLKKTHSIARAGKKGIRSIPNTRQNSCQTYHNNIKINLWYLCTCNSNIFNLEQSHLAHNFDISTAFSSGLGGFVLCHQLDVGRLRFDMSSWKHKFHGRVCTVNTIWLTQPWALQLSIGQGDVVSQVFNLRKEVTMGQHWKSHDLALWVNRSEISRKNIARQLPQIKT